MSGDLGGVLPAQDRHKTPYSMRKIEDAYLPAWLRRAFRERSPTFGESSALPQLTVCEQEVMSIVV